MKKAFILLLMVTAVTLFSGLGFSAVNNSGEQVVVGFHTEPERLDPTWEATLTTQGLLSNAYETLIAYNSATKKFMPVLATKWKRIDDLTWEFELRQKVKLHDGNLLTAEDIEYTFERMLDPKFGSRLKSQVGFIESVKAINNYTVRITSKEPYAPFLARISVVEIVGKASAQSYDAGKIIAPAGTGPYKLVKWNRQQEIIFEKNNNYWGKSGNVGRIKLRIIPNLNTRIAELKAGSIDIATGVTPDLMNDIKKQPKLKIITAPASILFIGANTFEGPLNNKKVRQALSYAIDSQAIAEKLYGGVVKVLNGPVSSRAFGYNSQLKPYRYSPKKAKQLLKEAGFPNGFTITYNGTTGKYTFDRELAEVLAQQLGAVGVKVNIELSEWGNYWKNFLAKKYKGLYNAAIGNPIEDSDFVLDLHFYSKGRGLYYNTPKLDELIELSRKTVDVEKRKAINNQMMLLIHDDAPWLLALETTLLYGVKSDIAWSPGAYGNIYFGDLKRRK